MKKIILLALLFLALPMVVQAEDMYKAWFLCSLTKTANGTFSDFKGIIKGGYRMAAWNFKQNKVLCLVRAPYDTIQKLVDAGLNMIAQDPREQYENQTQDQTNNDVATLKKTAVSLGATQDWSYKNYDVLK